MTNSFVANGARYATTRFLNRLARVAVCALVLPALLLSVGTADSHAAPTAPMAAAEVLYGVVQSGANSMLVIVDPTNGSTTDVGLIGVEGVTGLAFADNVTLYGVTSDRLLQIDPVTGVGDLLAFPGSIFDSTVFDISIRPSDGQIFGITFSADLSLSVLGKIDTGVGSFTPVGSTVIGQGGEGNGLAFTRDGTDTLYNATGEVTPPSSFGIPGFGNSDLLRLDDSTGAGTFIATLTDSGGVKLNGGYRSMAAAPDGTMFATRTFIPMPLSPAPEEHSLVTIDLVAGVATPIGDTSPGLDGLAFRPPADTGGGGPFEFASFDVDRLTLKKKKGDFDLRATFFLGDTSDGADIIGEDFTLQIAGYTLDLPAGSFRAKGRIRDDDDPKHRRGRFEFKSRGKKRGKKKKKDHEDELDIRIDVFGDGRYEIRAKGKGVDLGDLVNDVAVGLTIGNDFGTTSVRAKIHR